MPAGLFARRFVFCCGVLAIAVGLFAFEGAHLAFAHGEHCGSPNPSCGKYYVVQFGPAQYEGIKGSVYVQQNNDLKDEGQDKVANFYNLSNNRNLFTCGATQTTKEWAQTGIRDGAPYGDTQWVYYEYCSSCPNTSQGGGYSRVTLATTPANDAYERFQVVRPQNSSVTCGSETFDQIHIIRNGILVAVTLFNEPPDEPSAQTEHDNFHAHEPNTLVCFGTAFSCQPSTVEGVNLYNRPANSWALWTTGITTNWSITNINLYSRNTIGNWYSFINFRQ